MRAADAEPSAKSTDLESSARARFLLLFELAHSSEARQALAELGALLRGDAAPSFAMLPLAGSTPFAQEAELAEQSRLLDAELAAGRVQLELEPFANAFRERELLDIDLPALPPAARPEAETSSIVVRLIDQTGVPVTGRPVQIQLPDGAVHDLFTDPDGFARVKGFTQDGTPPSLVKTRTWWSPTRSAVHST